VPLHDIEHVERLTTKPDCRRSFLASARHGAGRLKYHRGIADLIRAAKPPLKWRKGHVSARRRCSTAILTARWMGWGAEETPGTCFRMKTHRPRPDREPALAARPGTHQPGDRRDRGTYPLPDADGREKAGRLCGLYFPGLRTISAQTFILGIGETPPRESQGAAAFIKELMRVSTQGARRRSASGDEKVRASLARLGRESGGSTRCMVSRGGRLTCRIARRRLCPEKM